MSVPSLPEFPKLAGRWQAERARRVLRPLLEGALAILLLLLVALAFGPNAHPYLAVLAGILGLAWLLLGGVFLFVRSRPPKIEVLSKRVDAVLGLPDDLLSLSEIPADTDPWRKATWEKTRHRFTDLDLAKAWPLTLPRRTRLSGALALLLTLGATGWILQKWHTETQRIAVLESARDGRAEAAEEMLKDWEEFVEETPDAELKKLFVEAGKLKDALQENDPRTAMLEINRIQNQMAQMEAAIANESIAGQSEKMAEALESFEGMAAMSAALRNQNFEAAAREAEKLAAELKKDANGQTALRREAAVAEMLATESKTAAKRGNQSLAEALQQLSQSAQASKGSTPNSEIAPPTESLRNQFSQESSRQNRGRAASTGKQQLDALKQRLQGESAEDAPFSSLCKGPSGEKPGGQEAGTGSTGKAQGDATQLAEAGTQESLTGKMGEGDSETRTTSAANGTATTLAGGKPTDFSQYAELSQKAVADENLPLAHRRVIRSYFERIRPIAETPKP